jgi:hypothetical protein
MNSEPAAQLLRENLFLLFRAQLRKDLEGAGIPAEFTDRLLGEYAVLKQLLTVEVERLSRERRSLLAGLLYRVDISETQLAQCRQKEPSWSLEEVMAELIIRRILQKVILKKTFSDKRET